MKNEELLMIRGGGIGSTVLNAVARLVNTVFEIGQAFGSSIRRAISGGACKAR